VLLDDVLEARPIFVNGDGGEVKALLLEQEFAAEKQSARRTNLDGQKNCSRRRNDRRRLEAGLQTSSSSIDLHVEGADIIFFSNVVG